MTPEDIAAVRGSFAMVAPNARAAGALFYDNLFALDPSMRRLFHGDIEEQAAKLMQVLAFAVANLEKPDALLPAVRALGQRHAGYENVAPPRRAITYLFTEAAFAYALRSHCGGGGEGHVTTIT